MRKKSIAIYTGMMDGRKAKGTATVIKRHLENLKRYKNVLDITLVHYSTDDNKDIYSEYHEMVIPKIWRYKYGGFINELLFFLRLKIRGVKFDIYFHFYNRLLPSFIFHPGRKFFFHAMDGGPKTSGYYGEARDPFPWYIKLFKRNIDKYIALSRFGSNGIKRVLNLSDENVVHVYNGLDTYYFNYKKDNTLIDESLKKNNIDFPYILCVSRFDPHKNIINFLAAYTEYLKVSTRKLPLVFVGGLHMPDYSRKVLDFIEKSGIKNKVHILKYVEFVDLPNIYAAADFLVYPSFYEGFGLPILEANATGCPIVCSNIEALLEIGDKSVLSFDPYNISDIKDKLLMVESDNSLKQNLRQKGYLNFKKYTWDNATTQLVKVFLKS